MTYGDRLRKRWIVVRLLPNMQHVDVGYFFKYTDALGYAEILQRLDPAYRFEVMFETGDVDRRSANSIADVALSHRPDRGSIRADKLQHSRPNSID